jgi:hypothetical protein
VTALSLSWGPTKTPQIGVGSWAHSNPTGEMALSGTRRHDCYYGRISLLPAEMQVSRASADLNWSLLRGDRTPEKRKVGGSTPPLTTRSSNLR